MYNGWLATLSPASYPLERLDASIRTIRGSTPKVCSRNYIHMQMRRTRASVLRFSIYMFLCPGYVPLVRFHPRGLFPSVPALNSRGTLRTLQQGSRFVRSLRDKFRSRVIYNRLGVSNLRDCRIISEKRVSSRDACNSSMNERTHRCSVSVRIHANAWPHLPLIALRTASGST